MRRVALLVALVSLVPIIMAGTSSGYTETTLFDGTHYDYETFGTDHGTYRATIHSVVSDEEVLYVSTVLEGYNVTAISAGAFSGCTAMRAVVIPERILTIGAGAFADCATLERVYFLGDAPDLSDDAFPDGVTFLIAPGTSGWDSGTNVIEYHTLTEDDGSSVLYYIIEDTAMAVGGTPSSDGDVTISGSVAGHPVLSIGPYSFSGENNASNTGIDARTDIKSVTVLSGVVTVRERAFYYNSGIISISIPPGIAVIMDEAFRAASSLTTVSMPASLTYIGFEAFRDCPSMDAIDIPDAVTFIGEGAFKICRGAETIRIGKGLTEISPWAFAYCSGAVSVEFRGNVARLDLASFYMCTALVSISLPDTVRTIGSDSFYYCRSLESAYLGDSLMTIGRNAFSECPVLNNVIIPGTVREIQTKAFAYCPALSDIYFEGSMPEFGDTVFLNNSTTVHCNAAYAASWSGYDGELVVDGRDDSLMMIAAIAAVVIAVCVIAAWSIRRKRPV